MRNRVACTISIPENDRAAFCRIRSSTSTYHRSPGGTSVLTDTYCGNPVGLLTRTGTYSSDPGARRMKPQLVERLDMKGNGWVGSKPRGVSAGEIWESK